MANGNMHIAVAITSGVLVGLYVHLIAGWAIALGNLAPDLDEYSHKKWRAS